MENEIDVKKSNKALHWTLLLLVVTVVLIVLFYSFYMKSVRQISQAGTEYGSYYVMITENRKSSFWQAVYEGAAKCGIEEGIYVDLLGDNLPSDYNKNDLFKMAISAKVDGIIIEADESEEMSELINRATEADIPVVTLINDNTQSSRCSFVGVGGYNIGREYGKQIKEIYNELRKDAETNPDDNIKVIVLVNYSGQGSGQNVIVAGLQETIEKEMGEAAKVEVELVSVDNSNAFSVEESVRDIFVNQEIPNIIVALDELTTTCVYQAVVDYNEVGNVRVLGYYNSDTINNAISRGAIYATILVDTDQLGKYCVEALKEYNELGNTSQYLTADITLINKSNVSFYLKKEEDLNE